MEERNIFLRNHILDRIAAGCWGAGEKLPGAREFVAETGSSLPIVQGVIDQLAAEGILETIPRRGTFVQFQWKERLLQGSMHIFRSIHARVREFDMLINREIPQLWITHDMRGVFELQNTGYIQSHCDEYLDLSGLFEECFPDRTAFFMKPFDAFRIGGRLLAVPVIYSPRVIFYNPELFRKAGAPLPFSGWSWDDFLESVRCLKKSVPPDRIFNWYPMVTEYLNLVVRAGGCLIDWNRQGDEVRIDAPETRRGLHLFRALRHELWGTQFHRLQDYEQDFLAGKAAMSSLSPRQFMTDIISSGLRDWATVELPLIPGGADLNVLATDALCIRRECVDFKLAKRLLQFLLGESFQNRLADWKYGIPVLKSAAGRSIDFNDPRDVLFVTETPKMYATYHLESVDLFNMVCAGIGQLLAGEDDIDSGCKEIADMVRTYLKIQKGRNIA